MAAVNLPDEGFTDGVIANRISELMAEHKDGDKRSLMETVVPTRCSADVVTVRLHLKGYRPY